MSDLRNTKFGKILTRSNKDIRDDRAISIIEDAEMIYKRAIENMEKDLRVLNRQRDAALDLSPGNSYSLKPGDFDADIFVKKDIELGVEIRNLEIRLQISKKKYDELFGDMAPSGDTSAQVIATN